MEEVRRVPAPTREEVAPSDDADVDLSVQLGDVRFPNPVTTASGCFGSGAEMERFFDVSELGAVLVKSVTLEPREGLSPPRMHETPSGMLNAIGLQNPGIDAWLERDLPFLQDRGARTILSVAGRTVDEFGEVARRAGRHRGVAAIEVNLSCPNVEHRGLVFACDPRPAAAVIEAVREQCPDRPVLAKLTPDVTDITLVGRACVEAGATGVSAINTTLGMAIDPENGRPRIANTYGGLSGPAIRPIAVRAVHQLHLALGPEVPIVGIGGLRTVGDVVEMIRAGASMVAIGTATFADPFVAHRLVDELRRWLARREIGSVADLRGQVVPW